MSFTAQFRSFGWPTRMLMINQFGINFGFYMLMPYLAGYLAGPLGLAAWAIGLVLGVRNFSQQGMFIIGGTLADRLGYKPLIVAGCLLRTAGFGLLVFAHSLPAIVDRFGGNRFRGALFNPAVRAYLAADSGQRRVEAFAMFNVFYQAGILAGPLVGTGADGGGLSRRGCRGSRGVRRADGGAAVRVAATQRRPGHREDGDTR